MYHHIQSITSCMKCVRIWSYSGPHFPAFGLNTERYFISLRIQFECGKMLARTTWNTDTFYAVHKFTNFPIWLVKTIFCYFLLFIIVKSICKSDCTRRLKLQFLNFSISFLYNVIYTSLYI